MRKIIGLIALVAIAALLSGCSSINAPNFEIMNRQSHSTLEGLDLVLYIDLTIKNTGGDGSKTIQVRVDQGSNYWTKEQSLYLKNEESQSITLRFPEVEFWTNDSGSYTVNII